MKHFLATNIIWESLAFVIFKLGCRMQQQMKFVAFGKLSFFMNYLFASNIFLNHPNGFSIFFRSRHLTLCHYPKSRHSMHQNTAQTKPPRTYKFKNTLPRQSLNTQKQTTKHQTHAHIHFRATGTQSCKSQSSLHMKSPNFYHTIVHDNDSMNEMLQAHCVLHHIAWVCLELTLPATNLSF